MRNFINSILLLVRKNPDNYWNKVIVVEFMLCLLVAGLGLILEHNSISYVDIGETKNETETTIMLTLHKTIHRESQIHYINSFSQLGNGKILVLKVGASSDLPQKLIKENWNVNQIDSNSYDIAKDSIYGHIFNREDITILILGNKNTIWDNLWFNIYRIWYIRTD